MLKTDLKEKFCSKNKYKKWLYCFKYPALDILLKYAISSKKIYKLVKELFCQLGWDVAIRVCRIPKLSACQQICSTYLACWQNCSTHLSCWQICSTYLACWQIYSTPIMLVDVGIQGKPSLLENLV